MSKENKSNDNGEIKKKLLELISEHEDLNDSIERLNEKVPFDQIKLQRLKKRKLLLKDEISNLKSKLLPDIIA